MKKYSKHLKQCNSDLLKLGMWNVEGLSNEKMQDPHFQKQLSQFNIACLVETWTCERNQCIPLSPINSFKF